MNKQAGFTLIELVLVIVILGILAATALPRFSDLSDQARVASLDGLAGGLRSAASIAHATYLATAASSGGSVNMDGASVQLSNGWPTNVAISNAILDFTGFSITSTSPTTFTLTASCSVTYNNPGNGDFPAIVANSNGGSC